MLTFKLRLAEMVRRTALTAIQLTPRPILRTHLFYPIRRTRLRAHPRLRNPPRQLQSPNTTRRRFGRSAALKRHFTLVNEPKSDRSRFHGVQSDQVLQFPLNRATQKQQ